MDHISDETIGMMAKQIQILYQTSDLTRQNVLDFFPTTFKKMISNINKSIKVMNDHDKETCEKLYRIYFDLNDDFKENVIDQVCNKLMAH